MVTVATVINIVIGRFSGEHLKRLAHVTVQLQPTLRLHCPITTLQIKIVIVMIIGVIVLCLQISLALRARSAYQLSLAEPRRHQTNLICHRSARKQARLGIYRTQFRSSSHDITAIRSVTWYRRIYGSTRSFWLANCEFGYGEANDSTPLLRCENLYDAGVN